MLENMVNFYLAPNLPADRHAFFGRNGGVSEGIYASFNFNRKSRDKAENIEKNLELVGRFYGLPGNAVMRPCQGHTDKAVYVDRPSRYEIEADGVVTDRPGIILGITTADCMPVLLADEKHGVIGAAHAGWARLPVSLKTRSKSCSKKAPPSKTLPPLPVPACKRNLLKCKTT